MKEYHDTNSAADEESEIALVKAQLATLVSDVRHLAGAEIEYLKLRAAYSGNLAKWIGIYGGLAAFCALCTIIAFVVGLLLIGSYYLGPIISTIIVTFLFAAIAVIAAMMAKSKAKQLSFKQEPQDE